MASEWCEGEEGRAIGAIAFKLLLRNASFRRVDLSAELACFRRDSVFTQNEIQDTKTSETCEQ